jgi:hypothetical protein
MQDPASGRQELTGPYQESEGPISRRRFSFSPFTFLLGFGAGAFAGVALAILAFSISDDTNTSPTANASLQADLPVSVSSGTPLATPDSRPRSKTTLDVRLGPGTGFGVVGTLARGDSVEVVGRDNDSQWLAIRFPPGSAGQGWIPVAGVDATFEINRLSVALATPLPRTVSTFPTGALPNDEAGLGAAPGPTRAANPSGTATPVPGPVDLLVTRVGILPDRRVSVTVANRGPGDLVGFTIFVQVRDLGIRSEVISTPLSILRVGQTLTVQTTTFLITGEEMIQATVDPFSSVPESDRTNNTMQVVLAAPLPPTPTPTTPSDPVSLP